MEKRLFFNGVNIECNGTAITLGDQFAILILPDEAESGLARF